MSNAIQLNHSPRLSARIARLRYTSDLEPGITRVKSGDGFIFKYPNGRIIRNKSVLERIRKLVIPPAWTDVWISTNPNGHLQATGRDARKRKQYRYHPRWSMVRDENKFSRIVSFGKKIPLIRKTIQDHLALPGMPREKILAACIQLLERTLIRVGNDEYVKANGSYGLTTLKDNHVKVSGSTLKFNFRGKSGKEFNVGINDRRLARIVKKSQELPGQRLFQYVEDGERRAIESADVNEYLRSIAGEEFSAKDFRTWAGTVLAALALNEFETFDSEVQAKKNVVEAIRNVAK
ncbi:MAG TPA: DNA topoisomerase IB, partial [Acidobacteriota bacterium]|nr:DNA topoisomerase IB [Acidobacteriota bacterium]